MSESPVDLSEFEALKTTRKKPCVVQHAATTLSKGEMRTLQAAFDAGYSNRIIAQWLGHRGLETTEHATRKHRLGECSCGA